MSIFYHTRISLYFHKEESDFSRELLLNTIVNYSSYGKRYLDFDFFDIYLVKYNLTRISFFSIHHFNRYIYASFFNGADMDQSTDVCVFFEL